MCVPRPSEGARAPAEPRPAFRSLDVSVLQGAAAVCLLLAAPQLLPCSPAPLRDPGDCGDSCTALGTHGQGCRRHVKLDLITVRCQFLQTRRSRRPLPCW